MPTLEEILATLEDEDAHAIKQALAAKDKEAQVAKRDLELAKNADLPKRFPRAWRAYSKGRLPLGDTVSNDEIIDKFKAMEADLTELGVPAGDTPPPTQTTPAEPATPDPAAAFGTPAAGGTSPTAARNLEQEFREAMASENPMDRVRLIELVDDMNGEERMRLVDTLNAPDSPLIRRSRGY